MKIIHTAVVAVTLLTSSTVYAEGADRDLCANRPGRGSPPCVLDVGRFQIEASVVDFAHDKQAGVTSETTLIGDLALRYGVTPSAEIELAWSPYVQAYQKNATGSSRASGYGDLTLAFRQSLLHPDGSGVSVAVQPFVSAPVGKVGTGAGAWQGGVAAPISIALPRGFGLGLTPQVAAVRNQSHDGAHLNWTGVAGLSHAVGPISLGTELYVNYDDDPTGGTTRASFDISAAWVPSGSKDLQLDIGLNAGLNRHTPDYEIYAGVARRF